LHDTTQLRELDSAADQTAVINWRLDDTQLHNPAAPLPWLPGISVRIATDCDWGPYLAARARLITDLADQVRTTGQVSAQVWMVERRCQPPADLVAEIQVWRAAMQVEQADLRPTGPKQPSLLARIWQHRLHQKLLAADIAQDQQWADLFTRRIPNLIKDSFMPSLVQSLENLDRAGFNAAALVQSAAAKGPLPDDHPAAALWWRILDELPPPQQGNSYQPTPAISRPNAAKPKHERHRPPQTRPSTLAPRPRTPRQGPPRR
jgi:hypothetical protein